MKKGFKYRLSVIWYYIKCFIAVVIYAVPAFSLFLSYALWGGAMFPKDPRDEEYVNDDSEAEYDSYSWNK